MLFAYDSEVIVFFGEEEPYEQLIEAMEFLELADSIEISTVVSEIDEDGLPLFEVFLSPVQFIPYDEELHDPQFTFEFADGDIRYIESLDTFQIGNIASFYLTLEHIVETF